MFDNNAKFPLNLTRDELVVSGFYEQEILEASVKDVYFNKLIKYLDTYKYDQDYILTVIKECCFDGLDEFFPLIFGSETMFSFASSKHKESDGYVLVDFIHPNNKRGFLYEKKFNSIKNKFLYSCFNQVEKIGLD